MEPVQPDSKRPRLSTNWSAAGPASLPSPSPYQHQHQHHQSHYSRSLDGSSGTTPGAGAGVSPPLPPHEDRRHHDQQDPYGRQPSTPTHAPSHPPPFPHVFNLRDGIKRDPGEDMVPLARRAPSNGDGLPATPNTIPPPSPYTDDPRRHMALDTGANMNQPYRPSAYATHGTMSHPQLYDGLPAHHSADSTIYSVFPTAVSNTKRKATRASQACDSCRQLKAKCDETKPCKGCREKGLECKYRDPIPKATDKAQADILDGINDVKQMIKAFSSEMGQIMMRMSKLESALQQVNPSFDPKLADIKTDGDQTMREASYTDSENGPMQPMPDEEEEMEENPGPPVAPGEPAIPINHTTLAGLLLGWPAIKDFVQDLLEKEKIEFVGEYPIRQEQERGLLRVYGRGEGHDSRFAKDDHGVIDIGDDLSDIASPAADWGTLGSGPLETKTSSGFGGPIDSSPDFSPDIVWSYVKSFRDNILNMMPIIMPNELNAMVQAFLESMPPKSAKSASTPTITKGFAVQSPVESVGSKRKRSPSPDGSRSSTASSKTAKPLRTITNAVVLVALALGKICQHKEGVPDVVQTSSPSHGSPLFRNGVPASPTQLSPSLRSQSSGLPSPNEFERRRSSHGGLISRPTYSSKRNHEVIPGLEYFAYATDIIGNQLGGTSMKHVWASVLAGLYHGQLGRVIESYAYISNGSKILQIIMRPSLDRLRKIRENAPDSVITRRRDNQIAFAFWTCLQLESDILAELPLPHSGILAHEDCIPYPNIVLSEDTYEPRIFESFMAQLYLRRHLNSIHKMFYHPNADIRLNPGEEDFSDMTVVQDRVRTMAWVSPSFHFGESDPPADDILAARLRAKYWGAQVITYRPFIKQILQFTHDMGSAGNNVDIRAYSQLNPRAIEYSKLGIRALIESTRAFHNLGQDRPIITNVFGTAHAQWGNMLVLGATSLDPFLGQFVDRELLQLLFTKTLYFLRRSSTASCNLRRDMRILEGVEKHVFRNLPPKQIYSGPSVASLPGGLSLQNHGYDQNARA